MKIDQERLNILDRAVTTAVNLGVAHCRAEDSVSTGRHVRIAGRSAVNFGSCSYLGLEIDPRIVDGAIEALRAHGTETSSSRAYLSSPLYTEFETLIDEIFDAHCVLAPTTTLAHLSALPILVTERDAMIIDHQVHSSVQMACQFVRGSGAHLEVAPHNNLEHLEERIVALSKEHDHVWYLADGVYSMFGDLAPTRAIADLLDRYPQFRFYVDDAHGMSWAGPRGSGTVLEAIGLHPNMVLATGLAKGFGTGGGVIVLPDEEQRRRIRACGPTLIFGGPIQPPILGAAIASAKIHLSDEIDVLQAELGDRMAYSNALFSEERVPVVSSPLTPVGFVGIGTPKASQHACRALLDEGIFTNPAQFPAAPMRRGGVRFLLTRHHTQSDIEALVRSISRNWEAAVRAGGSTPEEIWRAFDLEMPEAPLARPRTMRDSDFTLDRFDTIDKVDSSEWNACLGNRGSLGTTALSLFESVFGQSDDPVQHWDFRYYIVRDEKGEPVLATVFTKSLWKADMLADAAVSATIELEREKEPLHLTQPVFAMGCLLSEGEHLWTREGFESPVTQEAATLLMEAVRADASELGCDLRVVRDVPATNEAAARFFIEDGMMEMPMPTSFAVEDVCSTEVDLVASLPRKHRYHHRRDVAPFSDAYRVRVLSGADDSVSTEEIDRIQSLYSNVKTRNLALNTFDLPREFFQAATQSTDWEVVVLSDERDPEAKTVGCFVAYTGPEAYVPLVAGMDYDYVREHGLYRQLLRQMSERARRLGFKRVEYGMGADLEKRRMGGQPREANIMIEMDDHYALDAVAEIAARG